LAIGAPLQDVKLTNLRNILNGLIAELHDLSIDLENPPLLLADFFEHDVTSDEDICPGEVGLGLPPFTFVGAGMC
jgi:hypothetical protein